MAIPIIYVTTRKPRGLDRMQGPMFVLAYDAWNDYSYQTMFSAYRIDKGGDRLIGSVRILYEGQTTEIATSELLGEAPPAPQGGHRFTLGDRAFLSLGEKISYYSDLKEAFPERADWISILAQLNDTVYLEHTDPNNQNLKLRRERGFRTSLLRGDNETRAYGEARQTLYPEEFGENRFNFKLRFRLPYFTTQHEIDFRFNPDPARPTNTIVLIGPNGLGKTQALMHLAHGLIRGAGIVAQDAPTDVELVPLPPFKGIVAVSFSPFESFPISQSPADSPNYSGAKLDQSARYSYCGFRSYGATGPEVAWKRAWDSLIAILRHDEEKIVGRPKFPNLIRVLKDGLNYKSILVQLRTLEELPASIRDYITEDAGNHFLDVSEAEEVGRVETIAAIENLSIPGRIAFLKKDETHVGYFSAGQAMFVYMVFSAIAGVQRDSLLIIDEPELFLHPNLEMAYLRMLRTLLRLFESFAIVATHSVFVVREVPARNVRVFAPSDLPEVSISLPSIETFGVDIAEIANLVFDNIAATKPHEEWLKGLVKKNETYEDIKTRLGSRLTDENLTFLRNYMRTAQEKKAIEETSGDA
jgi:AAA domain, putative AbiEii toxin, Type IV TA system